MEASGDVRDSTTEMGSSIKGMGWAKARLESQEIRMLQGKRGEPCFRNRDVVPFTLYLLRRAGWWDVPVFDILPRDIQHTGQPVGHDDTNK